LLIMDASGEFAVYTLLAIAIVLLVFLVALRFVTAARRGHRKFKWWERAPRGKPSR
jgi:hypothetical protein